MKTFILFFCTTVFSFNISIGFSQNAKITIKDDKSISLEEIFTLIENQTDYQFIYDANLIKKAPKVFLRKGTIKVGDLLKKGLDAIHCTYDFSKNTIAVKPKTHPALNILMQDTYEIKGTVKDEAGLPLPGITVIYKEHPNRGTSTDIDGKYQILVNKNQKVTLQFSSIGFETQEININGRAIVNITMKETQNKLNEIVVVGYGSVKRKDLTGSVASVSSKEIQQIKTQTIDESLAGKLAGVFVSGNGGGPGSGGTINI